MMIRIRQEIRQEICLIGGKFCEAGGRIYYANPYDNDSLYVTDDKLQKSTKLHGDTVSI